MKLKRVERVEKVPGRYKFKITGFEEKLDRFNEPYIKVSMQLSDVKNKTLGKCYKNIYQNSVGIAETLYASIGRPQLIAEMEVTEGQLAGQEGIGDFTVSNGKTNDGDPTTFWNVKKFLPKNDIGITAEDVTDPFDDVL
jgi:hypothetical protein